MQVDPSLIPGSGRSAEEGIGYLLQYRATQDGRVMVESSDKMWSTRQGNGEGNGTPLQYFGLQNLMDGGAWWVAVHGVARVGHDWVTSLSLFTFHFHALEKEMATHSSVLAWRIPGTGKPGGLPSLGSHRVRHNWSDLAAVAAAAYWAPTDLWSSSFSILSFCLFILFMGFSRQEHWSGLPFPSPMHESGKWKWSCSSMSDSKGPHGLQPTRLLHPWDFVGQSTGGGAGKPQCSSRGRPGFRGTLWVASRVPSALSTSNS